MEQTVISQAAHLESIHRSIYWTMYRVMFTELCLQYALGQNCNIPEQYWIMSCEPRKKPSYFPLYWLVNRDPYNGVL